MAVALPCAAAEVHYVGIGEGSLILEVENDADSPVSLENVTVNLSGNPAYFQAPASVTLPDPVLAGQVADAVFPYTITSEAPDGDSFTVTLTANPQGTPNSVATDGSLDTLVAFTIDTQLPTFERAAPSRLM